MENKALGFLAKSILFFEKTRNSKNMLLPVQTEIPENINKVAILVSFYVDRLDALRLLRFELEDLGYTVIHILNVNKMLIPSHHSTYQNLVLRKNLGFDLAAYRDGLSLIKNYRINQILFINDSVKYEKGFFRALHELNLNVDTIYTLLDSYQHKHHFQSYFYYVKFEIMKSTDLFLIFCNFKNFHYKRAAVEYGEKLLHIFASRSGFEVKSIFSAKDLYDDYLLQGGSEKLSKLNPTNSLIGFIPVEFRKFQKYERLK